MRTIYRVRNPDWPEREERIHEVRASRSSVALFVQKIREKTPEERDPYSESAFVLVRQRVVAGPREGGLRAIARSRFRVGCSRDRLLGDVDVSGKTVVFTDWIGNACEFDRKSVERVIVDDLGDRRGPRVLARVSHLRADETGSVRIAGRRVAWAPGFADRTKVWVYDLRGRRRARIGAETLETFDIQRDGKVALCDDGRGLAWFNPATRRLVHISRLWCGDVRIARDRIAWTREPLEERDNGALKLTEIGAGTRRLLVGVPYFDWDGTAVAWASRSSIRYRPLRR